MVKAGHAIWKFDFYEAGKVYYRNTNRSAIGYLYSNENYNFAVYARDKSGGWKFVVNHLVSDRCRCGRLYTDTFNGVEFKWRDAQWITPETMANCEEIFKAPVLCQVCYYTKEYNQGNFCPKWVKKQIGVG